MTIQQVSVFIENSPGKLEAFTRLLGEQKIDLLALTLADTTQFGILRCLVKHPEEAVVLLTRAGYSARTTDVLAALVPDKPGGLAEVLTALAAEDISIEYCYSFARAVPYEGEGGAAIVFRVESVERAVDALRKNGVHLLDAQKLASL